MTLTAAEDKSLLSVFPVGMQNSALVIEDEDGNSVTTELDELSNTNDTNIVPAAINVENSSDVIFGPVTQFNGPVTIYQNVTGSPGSTSPPRLAENGSANIQNGKLVKSESTSSENSHISDKPNTNSLLYSKRLKYMIIFLILSLITAAITAVAIFYVKSEVKPEEPSTTDDVGGSGNSIKPAGQGTIIDKKGWGGRPALNWTTSLKLKHPVGLVIIAHTVTPFYEDFASCSQRVRSIQDGHIGSGKSPDIGYNFLICGDGNAYVGRGWNMRNFIADGSIAISYIGNYIYDHLTPPMINITNTLLQKGVESGIISKDYKLIAHNQTFATLSPGPNVYQVIKNWAHFDPSSYIDS